MHAGEPTILDAGRRSVAQLAVEIGRGTQPAMGQQCIAGDHAAFLPAQAGIEPLGITARGVQNEQCLAALAPKILGSPQQCGAHCLWPTLPALWRPKHGAQKGARS
jgi:hypothetical protein